MLRKGLLALFVFALFGFASAVSLYSSADHVSIRGTEGRVFYWLTNTDGVAKTVAFNADLGELNGFFEDDGIILPERGTKGTWLHLSAPLCFRGVERVVVKAEVCDADGNCVTLEKTLLVAANQPEHCVEYDDGFVFVDNFVPAGTYGDGSVASSTIVYATRFDPTEFEVQVWGDSYCPKAKPGETARKIFSIINRGAAGTFDLRVVSFQDDVQTLVSPKRISLSRGELEEISVDVQPDWIAPGNVYPVLQVLKNDVVLAEKPVCVSVEEVIQASVRLPQKVSGRQCEEISFQGKIENTGNVADSFEIKLPENAVAEPDFLEVRPGESALFSITIPADSLKKGKNDFLVSAKSLAKNIMGSASVEINAESCVAPSAGVKAVHQSQEQNTVEITVAVANEFDAPLENVTASLDGIPSQWSVESTTVSSIAPGETANLTLTLKTGGEEASAPILVIKSNGKEVARKPLQSIKPTGGITGLFTALSQNTLLIALLIVAALLVVVLTGRMHTGMSPPEFKASFKQKLEKIKGAAAD